MLLSTCLTIHLNPASLTVKLFTTDHNTTGLPFKHQVDEVCLVTPLLSIPTWSVQIAARLRRLSV